MKLLRLTYAVPVVLFFSLMGSVPFCSCTKNMADTVYIRHDSIIYVHDTTNVHDTTYDLLSGIVGYYTFNGGSLNDSSGFGNNIVFNNATPTKDRFGRDQDAYQFDGSTNFMRVANSPSLNPDNITLYAIVKVNGFYLGANHGNFILMKDWDQANGMYILQFTDYGGLGPIDTTREVFEGGFGDNNNTLNAAGVSGLGYYVTPGIWYKLTYTYDGITAKLYINGVLINSVTRTATVTDNSADLYFGRNMDPYNLYPFWFKGVIDEIRIYNRALPSQAVKQLVNQTN